VKTHIENCFSAGLPYEAAEITTTIFTARLSSDLLLEIVFTVGFVP
jgi:hypothetical protein